MADKMKAWLVDDCEIYAAPTGLEAMAAHSELMGDKAHICDLVGDEFLDVRYQAYDKDENPIDGETISIRELLADATEICWLATTVQ